MLEEIAEKDNKMKQRVKTQVVIILLKSQIFDFTLHVVIAKSHLHFPNHAFSGEI